MTNGDELSEAAAQVAGFISKPPYTRNTVLAAYLRREGLRAQGPAWAHAKEQLEAGLDFDSAARSAREAFPGQSGCSAAQKPVSKEYAQMAPTSTRLPRPDRPSNYGLRRYSAKFAPGAMDGEGAGKLLGNPDLSRIEVLVRETAQNSWDARGESDQINFTINLRTLDEDTKNLLWETVLPDLAPETGQEELRSKDLVTAIEVSDRGTVGLGGPSRNDLYINPSESTNYVDFVLSVGSPRDEPLGGGTYGFGKTVTYTSSEVGTVLIWSRYKEQGQIRSRFIASATGPSYSDGTVRYTGRHWWGHVPETGERVEPIEGAEADKLGEKLFQTTFGPGETGTSLLIISPPINDWATGSSPAEESGGLLGACARSTAEAVEKHLWPKLLDSQQGRQRMQISVQRDGQNIQLRSPDADPMLRGYAMCLYAVRAEQDGFDVSESTLFRAPEVVEIRSQRPARLLGHLALSIQPKLLGEAATQGVVLMRNRTELVVKTAYRRKMEETGLQWAGVFKPVDDTDDLFASAEPPAHDDWVPNEKTKVGTRDLVRIALKKIDDEVKKYTSAETGRASWTQDGESAVRAGIRLSGLMTGSTGSAPTRRRSGGARRASHADRPVLRTGHAERTQGSEPGWTRYEIPIELTGSKKEQEVVVDLSVATAGKAEPADGLVRRRGWRRVGGDPYTAEVTTLAPDATLYFSFEARADLALNLSPRVVVANG